MAEFAVRNVAVNFNRMIRVCERRQQQQPGKNGLMGLKRIYLTYSIFLYSGWQIPLRILFSSEIIYWTFVLVMVTTTLCPRHSLIHMPHNSHTDYTRITSYTNTPHQFPRICPYIYIPLSMASSLSISVGQHNGNEKPAIQTLPCLGLRVPLCWMATLIKPNLTHHWILFQASSVAWNVPMCHPNRNVLIHGQTEQSHIRTASDLMEATTCVALAFSLFFFLGGGGASEFTFCYADNGEYGTERAIIRLSFWLIAIIDSQYIWDAHRHSYEKTKKWIGASSAGIRTGP